MKILHVLDHSIPIQSGYTFRTLSILREQHAIGWQTCHVTGIRQHESPDKSDMADGIRFRRTPHAPLQSLPVLRYLGMVYAMMCELKKAIHEEKPDVMHAHSPSLNAVAAIWARRGTKLPLVYEVRAFWEDAGVDHGTTRESGIRYRAIRALETWALRRADAVTTICEGLRNDIVARGISADKVTVIPNAVNADKFEFMKPRDPSIAKKLGLDDGPVIGFVGSFYAYEGLDLLIEAMPAVLLAHPNARLVLVGGEEQESLLRQRTKDLELENAVIFVGRVPHQSVSDWYSVIDIVAYPRRSMRLTEIVTPLKPLEALALGKVLVLSDVGGHKEIASSLFDQAAFRAGDVDDLSKRLIERIQALPISNEVRSAGRHYVETERNWREVVSRYTPVYSALVDRSGQSSR